MKIVIIMRGIPGSGKSWHVKQHYPNAVVCSADNFWDIVEGGIPFDRSRIGEAQAWCLETFLTQVEVGREWILVDNTNVQFWMYSNYIKIAQMHGYRVSVNQIPARSEDQVWQFWSRNNHNVPISACMRYFRKWEDDPGSYHTSHTLAQPEFDFPRSLDYRVEELPGFGNVDMIYELPEDPRFKDHPISYKGLKRAFRNGAGNWFDADTEEVIISPDLIEMYEHAL